MPQTDFFDMVFQVVRLIPKGRVTSFLMEPLPPIWEQISSRAVGYAMNAAHRVKPKVPAHRVVNRNGQLTGKHHFDTPYRMQELLEKEKIKVENDTVVEFKAKYWDPETELRL